MKKLSYLDLQKKYAARIVALNKEETKVVTAGKRFGEIFKKLKQEHIQPTDCVFVGPIQKKGTINVYLSL